MKTKAATTTTKKHPYQGELTIITASIVKNKQVEVTGQSVFEAVAELKTDAEVEYRDDFNTFNKWFCVYLQIPSKMNSPGFVVKK